VPASVTRDVTETMLMEEFHWLPKEIAEIPYITLQKLFIIRKQRQDVMESKKQVEQFKSQHQSKGSGSRSYTREV